MEKTAKKTQADRLLAYLKTGKEIGQIEAYKSPLHIADLPARVFDLKKQGYEIKTTLVLSKNELGERTRYAKYKLVSSVDKNLDILYTPTIPKKPSFIQKMFDFINELW